MKSKQHIHFVGIGGIGMSGIAKITKLQNYIVSGCDPSQNSNTEELEALGCKISQQHCSTICKQKDIDLVVYSSAITDQHPELIMAKSSKTPTINRAGMLAKIMKNMRNIGIAGSHGKTTTSSILSHIMLEENFDPTIVIGGNLNTIKSNAHHGTSNIFIAETDESDRSLLQLPVTIPVLNNIDYEHPDQYKNIEDVTQTFEKFINQSPHQEKAIVNGDDRIIQKLIDKQPSKFISFGTKNHNHFQIKNIEKLSSYSTFDIYNTQTGILFKEILCPLPGLHNIYNACAALITAHYLGLPIKIASEHLKTFKGVDRRFSYKGTTQNKIEIFDDYGHHPTEIKHTLTTATKRSKNNLIVVFQPQRYTRTKHLWNDFVDVLTNNKADYIIVTDIYAASEEPITKISGENLVLAVKDKNPSKKIFYASTANNFDMIDQKIKSIINPKDLLLFLGAGKVNQMISRYIKN